MPNEAKGRIKALDGLRAIAIILVILSHSVGTYKEQVIIKIGQTDFSNLLYNGWVGVDLFFVLSGFLITSQLLHKTLNKRNLKTYALRRFFRIAPAYYVIVLLTLILYQFIPEIAQDSLWMFIQKWWLALLSHFIFLHDYIGRTPYINGLFWSIPIEIKFYLALPVLILLLARVQSRTNQSIAILSFFILYVLMRAFFVYMQYGGETVEYAEFYHNIKTPFHLALDGLTIGVLCAFLLNSPLIKTIKNNTPLINGLFISGSILFLSNALWSHLIGKQATFFEYSFMTPLFAISFGMILFALVHGCFATNFFGKALLRFIAKISYCLYLSHLFAVSIQAKFVELISPYFTSPTLCWLLALSVLLLTSFILAYILHRTIEQPFLKWSKKTFLYDR